MSSMSAWEPKLQMIYLQIVRHVEYLAVLTLIVAAIAAMYDFCSVHHVRQAMKGAAHKLAKWRQRGKS